MPQRAKPLKYPRAKTLKQRILGFLASYQETCSITEAARLNGISRDEHYQWLKTKPKYAELFKKVQAIAAEYLEAEAVRRAAVGWEEPIFYQGSECGKVRRYDGGLMQFLLRGMMPEKYGAKAEAAAQQPAQPLQAQVEIVFVKPSQLEPRRVNAPQLIIEAPPEGSVQ